jgi:hypothetical protein
MSSCSFLFRLRIKLRFGECSSCDGEELTLKTAPTASV